MSIFLIKSILAVFFLLTGLIAVICMLTLMGKTDRKVSANFLRKTHKSSGFVFTCLLLIISYFCIKYWVIAGDHVSLRAVFHAVLAFGLIIVLLLKLAIVQFYKQFLRLAPVMGIIVFVLSFVVFSTSAGYFLLRSLNTEPELLEKEIPFQIVSPGNTERGASIFKTKCSSCHSSLSEEIKMGPGLKNVLKKAKLPSSERPANLDNIKKQLKTPFLAMPSFTNLSDQDLADLLAYMETL